MSNYRVFKLILNNYIILMNRKWTDGQPYERSRRMKHQIQMEQEEFSKKIETTAYSSSLNHDENTWEILNQSSPRMRPSLLMS